MFLVVEQEIFQVFASENYEDVNLRELVFDSNPLKIVKDACPIAKRQKREAVRSDQDSPRILSLIGLDLTLNNMFNRKTQEGENKKRMRKRKKKPKRLKLKLKQQQRQLKLYEPKRRY